MRRLNESSYEFRRARRQTGVRFRGLPAHKAMHLMIAAPGVLRRCRASFPTSIILFLSIGGLTATAGHPQQPTRPGEAVKQISLESYERILDVLFPVAAKSSRGLEIAITLRTRPSFAPESQITLKLSPGKPGTVELLTANRSVWAEANRLTQSTAEQSPEALARYIAIDRKVFEVPAARAELWHSEFCEALRAGLAALEDRARVMLRTQEAPIVLDDDEYEFWYAQGTTFLTSKFSESDMTAKSPKSEPSFAKWARTIRDAMTGGSTMQR